MLRVTPATMGARVRDDERGMTLVELLVGISIGMVILFAAFFAMESANRMQTRTASRIDAVNRGRSAMESITRAVRSQQCFQGARPMLWASDTGMEFYASVAPESTTTMQPAERRRLEWVPNTAVPADISNGGKPLGDIVEKVWRSTTNPTTGAVTWPTAPTTTRQIAEDVQQAPDRDNPTALAPFFQYYKYAVGTGSGRVNYSTPVPMIASTDPIYNPTGKASAASGDLVAIVLIRVNYSATPRRTKTAKSANVNFYDTISVRIADPTNPAGSPTCL